MKYSSTYMTVKDLEKFKKSSSKYKIKNFSASIAECSYPQCIDPKILKDRVTKKKKKAAR